FSLSMPRAVTKETASDSFADPLRLDPEIGQPPQLASLLERAPADHVLAGLGDEDGPELLRREVAAVGPFPHFVGLVAPELLGRDRDLLEPTAFLDACGTNRHRDRRSFSHSAFLIAKASQSLLKYA